MKGCDLKMADVKRRGRPPKVKNEDVELKNEGAKQIKMDEQISIEQPYKRMQDIFNQYFTNGKTEAEWG